MSFLGEEANGDNIQVGSIDNGDEGGHYGVPIAFIFGNFSSDESYVLAGRGITTVSYHQVYIDRWYLLWHGYQRAVIA